MKSALTLFLALLAGSFAIPSDARGSELPAAWIDEPAAIAASGGRATRNGPLLTLVTGSGPVKFENGHGPDCSTPNCVYSLVRPFAGQGFLLLVGYENSDVGGFMWVDENNARTVSLDGIPDFSPDGRHFAIVSTCDGLGKCVLQIWKTEGPELLFERRPTDDEYEDYINESWDGNNRIAFDIGIHESGGNSGLTYSSAAIAETATGQWQFISNRRSGWTNEQYDEIKKLVLACPVREENCRPKTEFVVKILKVTGPYTKVSITGIDGTGETEIAYLKMKDGRWVLLDQGTGINPHDLGIPEKAW